MDYADCLKRIQEYLEDRPLIVLGSGASASFGLPLMSAIKNEILSYHHVFSDKRYSALFSNLQTMGLEEAIDQSDLPSDLSNQVREFVWDYISRHDIQLFRKLTASKTGFAMAELLHKVLMPTPNVATVITTNYDRVAEYAADIVGASVVTGFEGNLIRKMEFPNTKARNTRILIRERTVQIFKVHGSLDWFRSADGDIVSYPMTSAIPPGHEPLIIPPGKDKYSTTHNDPFRGVMGTVRRVEDFGSMLYQHAVCNGLADVDAVVFLGDGAKWLWSIQQKYFPYAFTGIDLYHSTERANTMIDLLQFKGRYSSNQKQAFKDECIELLRHGKVQDMLDLVGSMTCKNGNEKKLEGAMGYFSSNIERMNYSVFSACGIYVGSGVIEAGCKVIVGNRMKNAGMHWSKDNAEKMISLRCAIRNGIFLDSYLHDNTISGKSAA